MVGAPIIAISPLTLVFSIEGGNDDSFFAIDACTGQITVDSPGLDYELETQYMLNISVTADGDALASASASITINIIDINDPPELRVVGPAGTSLQLQENSPVGARAAGFVVAFDAENDRQVWNVSRVDPPQLNGAFRLVPSSPGNNTFAQLEVARNLGSGFYGLLNFERTAAVTLVVEAVDASDRSVSAVGVFNLVVLDGPDAPSVIADQVIYLDEAIVTADATVGELIGTQISVLDEDEENVTMAFTGTTFGASTVGGLGSDGTARVLTANDLQLGVSAIGEELYFRLTRKLVLTGTPSRVLFGSQFALAVYSVDLTATDQSGATGAGTVSVVVTLNPSSITSGVL